MPYSGPASAYGIIGRTMSAYFRMVNDNGGINGRTVEFISYDDGYNPSRAVEQARRLVEDDEVLAIFAPFGTASNAAIQRYMNNRHVPQLFAISGASRWADPVHFPWTIGWLPSYRTEARIYADYILTHHPGARIGVLYQNDDFGRDYLAGLKDVLQDRYPQMVVASLPYEISEPTIDSQIVAIKAAAPDIFINVATPKFAAQAIRKLAELDWHPVHIMTNVSVSVGSVEARGTGQCEGSPECRVPDGRDRPAVGLIPGHAALSHVHGEILSGRRSIRKRPAGGIQYVERAR